MQQFVRSDREDCKCDGPGVLVTAIKLQLTDKGSEHSIFRDRTFKSSKQLLAGKP